MSCHVGFNHGKVNQYPLHRRLSEAARSESEWRLISSGPFIRNCREYKNFVMFKLYITTACGMEGVLDVTNNIF